MRMINGGGERVQRDRARTVHRLLSTPETVTPQEASAFLDAIARDFQTFVQRTTLHEAKAPKATRRAR
jgi:hypothetical protein